MGLAYGRSLDAFDDAPDVLAQDQPALAMVCGEAPKPKVLR